MTIRAAPMATTWVVRHSKATADSATRGGRTVWLGWGVRPVWSNSEVSKGRVSPVAAMASA